MMVMAGGFACWMVTLFSHRFLGRAKKRGKVEPRGGVDRFLLDVFVGL